MSQDVLTQNLIEAVRPVIDAYLQTASSKVEQIDDKSLALAKKFAEQCSKSVVLAAKPKIPRQPIDLESIRLSNFLNL